MAETISSPRAFLAELFRAAVEAVHPSACLVPFLPAKPAGTGRLIVLAAGKAAGSMAEVVERFYLDGPKKLGARRLIGLAVTRRGYGRPTRRVKMVEAGHPIPDEAGLAATEKTLELADSATEKDLVLVLLSGGASANWIAPAQGLTLAEKQNVTRALLRSGASIGEMNTLRKHLSRIKGGRLAARAQPAKVVTLAISDVAGDDPAVIGSGPTVSDPTTLADAQAVVASYGLDVSAAVMDALADPSNETPKPGDPLFEKTEYQLVAKPANAFFRAASDLARAQGCEVVFLGDRVVGEARDVAAEHARLAREIQSQGRRALILSGGELTVTVRGKGLGGPNQEYALALATHLNGLSGISALAADTDGTDGGAGQPDDPAGAIADTTTVARARAIGLDPAAFLADNNSSGFFFALG